MRLFKAFVILPMLLIGVVCLVIVSDIHAGKSPTGSISQYKKYSLQSRAFALALYKSIPEQEFYVHCAEKICKRFFPDIYKSAGNEFDKRKKIKSAIEMFKKEMSDTETDRYFYIPTSGSLREYDFNKQAFPLHIDGMFVEIADIAAFSIDYSPKRPYYVECAEEGAEAFLQKLLSGAKKGNRAVRVLVSLEVSDVQFGNPNYMKNCSPYFKVRADVHRIDIYPAKGRITENTIPLHTIYPSGGRAVSGDSNGS